MKNWRKLLWNPTIIIQIISISLLVFSIGFNIWTLHEVTIPYQEKTLRRSADIVLDIIPSVGRIDGNFYFTQTRTINADLVVDFYVIVWNKGNGTAENVSVILRGEPQTSNWFDYHWSIVSISGFSYRPSTSNASIRALLPNQQAQIQYHVSFNSSGYDQSIEEGKEAKIIIKLNFASTTQRYEYIVIMP